MAQLEGKRIAFLATHGVDQRELTQPWAAVEQAGGRPELISLEAGTVQGYNHLDAADTFEVAATVADADPGDYDAAGAPRWRGQPRHPPDRSGRGGLRSVLLPTGQAGGGDLPRAVDTD